MLDQGSFSLLSKLKEELGVQAWAYIAWRNEWKPSAESAVAVHGQMASKGAFFGSRSRIDLTLLRLSQQWTLSLK